MMKQIIIFIGLMLSSCLLLHDATARVSLNTVSDVAQKQYTVFGVYEGYKNGVVRILHTDGTRQGLPFKDSLLSKISTTRLGESIKLVVDNGVIITFERNIK